MPSRLDPAPAPFPPYAQAQFARIMPPGVEPLALFTTLATDERLFGRFMNAGLLDRGHLTLRQREIVIDRVTAACGSEYEWGVHVAFFAAKAELSRTQITSIVDGGSGDPCWSAQDERCLLRLCDVLHASATIDNALWAAAREHFSARALVEILMLAGFYRMVSYLTNGLALPLEPWAARFDDYR